LCQISSKSVKRLQIYGELTFFQNGGRPPSWIFKIYFFCDFQHGGGLDFQKFEIFNCLSTVGRQYASPCQIASKSVKRLQRCGDLTVFKITALRHLGF